MVSLDLKELELLLFCSMRYCIPTQYRINRDICRCFEKYYTYFPCAEKNNLLTDLKRLLKGDLDQFLNIDHLKIHPEWHNLRDTLVKIGGT